MVIIRRCRAEDVPDVLAFLAAHWKTRHIFTVDRRLFDWQHQRLDRPGEYSFALARRVSDEQLVGVLGFIVNSRFDPALSADDTLWLALWKVRDDMKGSAVGLQLLKFVVDQEATGLVGVVGFNEDVRALYEVMGFTVGELHHYVIPNPDTRRFELARFHSGLQTASVVAETDALTAAPFPDGGPEGLSIRHAQLPAKSPAYFWARYVKHPTYRYCCEVLNRGTQSIGVLVTRLAEHAGRAALRVVDYYGPEDVIPTLRNVILRQLRETGAEYADLYNWGIDPLLFRKAGFSKIDPDGPDIVPDHFEPFEQRNIRLRFAVKTKRPVVLFKGDGDQDRPNRVPS